MNGARPSSAVLARYGARQALNDELNDDLTALLLCCGLAIAEAGVSEAAMERLRTIEEGAEQIRVDWRLRGMDRRVRLGFR